MTEAIEVVTDGDERVDQQALAEQLLAEAKACNFELISLGVLLNQRTKRVLESAMEADLTEHLCCDRHDPCPPGHRQLPLRGTQQTVVTPDRPGRDRRALGHQFLLRAGDRAQAATSAGLR